MKKEHQNFDEEAIYADANVLHDHLTGLHSRMHALIDRIEDLHIDRERLSADLHRWRGVSRQAIDETAILPQNF
jgi:hypothetical protein